MLVPISTVASRIMAMPPKVVTCSAEVRTFWIESISQKRGPFSSANSAWCSSANPVASRVVHSSGGQAFSG